MLNAGFKEVGGLEEHRGEDARGPAGEEVRFGVGLSLRGGQRAGVWDGGFGGGEGGGRHGGGVCVCVGVGVGVGVSVSGKGGVLSIRRPLQASLRGERSAGAGYMRSCRGSGTVSVGLGTTEPRRDPTCTSTNQMRGGESNGQG